MQKIEKNARAILNRTRIHNDRKVTGSSAHRLLGQEFNNESRAAK
jgi:hypothetical protein